MKIYSFAVPFSRFIDYRYEKVLNQMLSDDIQDKTNVINYFVYNNIITHTLGTAIQEINEYFSRVLLFKTVEKVKIESNFYIPKMLNGKEFKTILKRPENLVKEYTEGKTSRDCSVKITKDAPNRQGITASNLTFVKLFGEYKTPETSEFRKDLRDRIADTISECFKEAVKSCKLEYQGKIRPKIKTGDFGIPKLEPLDYIELDWLEDNCFKYSINLNLCNK